MATPIPHVLPVIGNWYQDASQDLYFEVVAIDAENGEIEVQYYGGEVGGFDRESWQLLQLTPAAPPEDASSAFDLTAGDAWYSDDLPLNPNWDNPLDQIEPDLFDGFDDY